jgi:hypothetical protein
VTTPAGPVPIGRPRRPRLVVVVTAVRSALAFAIGGVIMMTSDHGESALAGFMGAYWLVSGLFSLAWAVRGPFLRRLSFVAGCIGVVTGAIWLLYPILGRDVVTPEVALMALGAVIGVTGVLHLSGGYLVGERMDRWPAGHMLLGIVELVLAGALLLAPARPGLAEVAAAAWAFGAGSVLAFDAVRARRRWSGEHAGVTPATQDHPRS